MRKQYWEETSNSIEGSTTISCACVRRIALLIDSNHYLINLLYPSQRTNYGTEPAVPLRRIHSLT
jgi:hypothetical protein